MNCSDEGNLKKTAMEVEHNHVPNCARADQLSSAIDRPLCPRHSRSAQLDLTILARSQDLVDTNPVTQKDLKLYIVDDMEESANGLTLSPTLLQNICHKRSRITRGLFDAGADRHNQEQFMDCLLKVKTC